MQRKQGQWKELFHVKEPFSAASSGKQQTAGCILRFQRRLKKIPAVRENTSKGNAVQSEEVFHKQQHRQVEQTFVQQGHKGCVGGFSRGL